MERGSVWKIIGFILLVIIVIGIALSLFAVRELDEEGERTGLGSFLENIGLLSEGEGVGIFNQFAPATDSRIYSGAKTSGPDAYGYGCGYGYGKGDVCEGGDCKKCLYCKGKEYSYEFSNDEDRNSIIEGENLNGQKVRQSITVYGNEVYHTFYRFSIVEVKGDLQVEFENSDITIPSSNPRKSTEVFFTIQGTEGEVKILRKDWYQGPTDTDWQEWGESYVTIKMTKSDDDSSGVCTLDPNQEGATSQVDHDGDTNTPKVNRTCRDGKCVAGESCPGTCRPPTPDGTGQSFCPLTHDQDEAIEATVKMKVRDNTGTSYGSGTIIGYADYDSVEYAIVLTAAHVVKTIPIDGMVEMDMDADDAQTDIRGVQKLYNDSSCDVAILRVLKDSIEDQHKVKVNCDAEQKDGDSVFSVGHGLGSETANLFCAKVTTEIVFTKKWIVIDKEQVVGRSGGGLFNECGELIGVISATSKETGGLHGNTQCVKDALTAAGLGFICDQV
ncbi:trypsin-like peptidase domain-containing protein [archaeon]|jgi:S1-C subfamily serine protease|nr:trypsin-like peptidase domain-containing protein [archaeon]MBT4241641.1 trypsin-like peptidase domain-containing protein [archaeon]MBT4418036.1 trypsin-like peptidase domain-containing protein [archaeon]